MEFLKLVSLLFMAAVFFASCQKDETALPVEFRFVLLDTLGNEKNVFNQGENIIFSFQVINKTSEDLMLENFFPNDDFFRVYQSNASGTLDYGVPYKHLFCEFIGALPLSRKDTFCIVIPWYENEKYTKGYIGCPLDTYHRKTAKLPKGNYYTEFSQSFKIGDIQTEEKHFKINFTVK